MRVSEALEDFKPLAIKFGSAVLNVEYRPPSWTITQLEQTKAAATDENFDRLAGMLMEVVRAWDLTRIEKVPDDRTESGFIEREVPIDITVHQEVKDHVPLSLINRIIKAIQEDNAAGEA